MRLIVASPSSGCPAGDALVMEGLEPEVRVLEHPYSYGELLTELWEERSPFVLIEWDVVPWPGAVKGLMECPEPWCAHEYPLSPGSIASSLGINKLRPEGPAPAEWADTRWNRLDGEVVPVLNARLRRKCLHTPAVAHARVGGPLL